MYHVQLACSNAQLDSLAVMLVLLARSLPPLELLLVLRVPQGLLNSCLALVAAQTVWLGRSPLPLALCNAHHALQARSQTLLHRSSVNHVLLEPNNLSQALHHV